MKKISPICTFCNKSPSLGHKIVVSGQYSICDICIELFAEVVNREQVTSPLKSRKKSQTVQLNSLKIRKFLDQYVIGQEQAKIALCVSVVNHYKRLMFEEKMGGPISKNNLLITGPSGSGKSLLIGSIAQFLDVPFVNVDATTLTEAGYIGQNVDTIISRLLVEADGDPEKAEQGIVFIDEIDKIAQGKSRSTSNDGRVSGIQSSLLKMVEGSVVPVMISAEGKRHGGAMVEIHTDRILFICGGAFVGLNEIVAARIKKKQSLGFTSAPVPVENLEAEYCTEDFIEFGMIPEFIGRFSLKTFTKELTEHELIEIMTNVKNSMLSEYQFYFGVDGIELDFTPDFIEAVAKQAKHSKTGVRGLRAICEKVMLNHLYLLPEYQKRRVAKMTFDSTCADGKQIPKIEVYAAVKKAKKILDNVIYK